MTLKTFDCDTKNITKQKIQSKWEKFLECETCVTFFTLDTCQPYPYILVRVIDNNSDVTKLQELINSVQFGEECLNNFFYEFGEFNFEIVSYTPIKDSKIVVFTDEEIQENSNNTDLFPLLESCNLTKKEIKQFEQIEEKKLAAKQKDDDSLRSSFSWGSLKIQTLPDQLPQAEISISPGPQTEQKNYKISPEINPGPKISSNNSVDIENKNLTENQKFSPKLENSNNSYNIPHISNYFNQISNPSQNDLFIQSGPKISIVQNNDVNLEGEENKSGKTGLTFQEKCIIYASVAVAVLMVASFLGAAIQRRFAFRLLNQSLPVTNVP